MSIKQRSLTSKEETRINRCIQDRIQHFSPTIAPAPKNMEQNEIESIRESLLYYLKRGVEQVIIQPKFMGSYCDLYLDRDIEKSKFFSRNAYSINSRLIKPELLIQKSQSIWNSFQKEWDQGAKLIIVQAELMPWSALGKGLITRDFGGYGICHQSHANYLATSELPIAIAKLMQSENFKSYLKDVAILSDKEISVKYPQHVIKQYEALRFVTLPNLTAYQKALKLYHHQVEIYGQSGELYFQPFNWLKIVYEDREEINVDNLTGFQKVSDQPFLEINLKDATIDTEFPEAYQFFDALVARGMEGVVIKPRQVWLSETAPMFKVRNNNYLQMIYGIRFQDDYDYYLERRKTGKKIKCSINEWNIAQSLLRIPMKEINNDNKDYYELIKTRILEEDFEMTLDSRL